MNALKELLNNQSWMIHGLVDSDKIDNQEEARLLKIYKAGLKELAALEAELMRLRGIKTITVEQLQDWMKCIHHNNQGSMSLIQVKWKMESYIAQFTRNMEGARDEETEIR